MGDDSQLISPWIRVFYIESSSNISIQDLPNCVTAKIPVFCMESNAKIQSVHLMAHNWQKWKRVFLTCPCHKIYRDEAVGLKICKYTWKITIFVKMWNLGQYRENLTFCQ